MQQAEMFEDFASQSGNRRLITPEELAVLCRFCRTGRGWSQETLAEVSGVTVRTIQRVENGSPSGLDTRRALARAFGAEDIDCFNKPDHFPTPDEFEAEQKRKSKEFERHYTTLEVQRMTGRSIVRMSEGFQAACMELSEALSLRNNIETAYAVLKDYVREFLDIASDLSASDRLVMGDKLQAIIDDLARLNASVVGGTRSLSLRWGKDVWKISAVYLFVAPRGKEPSRLAVPRTPDGSL